MTVTVLFELRIKPDAVPAARDLMHRTLEVTNSGTRSSTTRPTGTFVPAKEK